MQHSNGAATNGQQKQPAARDLQVRHLASLISGLGQLPPEEGLQRLRELPAGGGTQCRLQLQPAALRILDAGPGGQLMEDFPMRAVRQPLAFEGGRENLLLFSVQGEASWEMHIFQLPAAVSASSVAKEIHQLIIVASGAATSGGGKADGNLVQVLNRCLEEVEAFSVRLQQQHQHRKEPQQQPPSPSQGTPRSRRPEQPQPTAAPPTVEEFVDTLKKLKLALNLLGRLEGRIHQPNAPELVHCLFAPLALMAQVLGGSDLPSRVLSPLLTSAAVALLKHCLTSAESELWYGLGPAWTCHRQRWLDEHAGGKLDVPPFRPKFGSEGWQPELEPELLGQGLSKSAAPQPPAVASAAPANGTRGRSAGIKVINPVAVSQHYSPYANGVSHQQQQQHQQQPQQLQRPVAQVAPKGTLAPPRAAVPVPSAAAASIGRSFGGWDARQERLRVDAASRGHRVVQAVHDKAGRNAKELTVQRGELLEVLDDSRNWWQLRNCVGEVGYAPYTILHVL